jgi:hypothetical protein
VFKLDINTNTDPVKEAILRMKKNVYKICTEKDIKTTIKMEEDSHDS